MSDSPPPPPPGVPAGVPSTPQPPVGAGSPPPNVPPTPAPKSGGGSGKKWWLIGCGGAVLLVLLCGGCFVGFFQLVLGMLKNNDVYQESLARASSEPAVIEALGEPIEPGWMVSGNYSEADGIASLDIPISGPNGSGSIHTEGELSGGTWQVTVLRVTIDGNPTPVQILP